MQPKKSIPIYLDGNILELDVDPVVYSGGLLVPIYNLARSLGAKISWAPESQTAIVTYGKNFVLITVGKNTAYKNHKPIQLDIPPRIVDGRTLVPLNFLGEAMEVRAKWHDRHNTAVINSKMKIALYYPLVNDQDGYLIRESHEVKYTRGTAKKSLNELIDGQVTTPGACRVLPPDTSILDISINNGLATVDFSQEVLKAGVGCRMEELGIKSIVNTLTEFPGIKEVSFMVEGKLDERAMDWWGHVGLYNQPFSRDLSVVGQPRTWVISPSEGQVVKSPLKIRGLAGAGSGVNARLLDANGLVIATGFTSTSPTDPAWAEYHLSLPFTRPDSANLWLEVFRYDELQGTIIDKETISLLTF